MQASKQFQILENTHSYHNQPMHQTYPQTFQIMNNYSPDNNAQQTSVPVNVYEDHYHTLESTPITIVYSSPSTESVFSNKSPFSPDQNSYSNVSDLRHSYDGSPWSTCSGVDDEYKMMYAMWALRTELPGPESDVEDSGSFTGIVSQPSNFTRYNKILEIAPHMNLKDLLVSCAKIVSEAEAISFSEKGVAVSAAVALMDILGKMVSVSGEPLQRLGAYMVEGLRARLLSSGSIIYKKQKCKEPTSSELLSYMHVLSQICPYYKFAYLSANVVIGEIMEYQNRIHIIDFQIAQGSQWVPLIQALSRRSSGPPHIRITGIDDSGSAHARGGGLELVGQLLERVAKSCGVPFEFHGAAMSGCEVTKENLRIRHGEALAVNFPYILHHVPDESVSTVNHRDRILQLIKSLSPKVVTLVEQESNTNTGNFFQRFCETLEFYTAMFESIDAARSRDDKQRISAEEHCVAKDVVNIIACEGSDRVERHEPFGKWRMRLMMAGFSQIQLSSSVGNVVNDMLKEYNPNYKWAEGDGAVYLGWKDRALATTSAWT